MARGEFSRVAIGNSNRFYRQLFRGNVDPDKVLFIDIFGSEDERSSGGVRRRLLEQLQPFAAQRLKQACYPSGIAFGTRDAFHKAAGYRVAHIDKDNRNGSRSLQYCLLYRKRAGGNDVGI